MDKDVEARRSVDFIREIVEDDIRTGKHGGKVHTRFPPEPNGYLHIGHAKSICLNFGIALQYGGKCNLRFDDTNPTRESVEYVESIKRDVRWLGFNWDGPEYFASDYFGRMADCAALLIKKGKAYVCDLTQDEVRQYRGTLTEAGLESPCRSRGVEENLDLFDRMRKGEFEEGSRVLRAKIDMTSPNIHMRDPVLYRILKASHHRTGDSWCVYPTYDFSHCLEDAYEGITHSICTLEFEIHRPLYDWFVSECGMECVPRQYEFARLNLNYTVMSKRKLLELVSQKLVSGWDDPRLPTISGLRRRGYTPQSIRDFCAAIGVTKYNSVTEISLLEHFIREDLNKKAPRVMAVLDPVRLVIENYPDGQTEEMQAVNNPEDPGQGTRAAPFSKVLYIERDDFREEPPKKYYRLAPGQEVRLRYAYLVRCVGFTKSPETGEITEIRCVYDPATKGGNTPDGRKVKGTIHWVSASHALDAEVRLYDRLFTVPDPDAAGGDYKSHLNPASLKSVHGCKLEPSLSNAKEGVGYQFERVGYFCVDAKDSTPGRLVFNRTVALKDSWSKMEQAGKAD